MAYGTTYDQLQSIEPPYQQPPSTSPTTPLQNVAGETVILLRQVAAMLDDLVGGQRPNNGGNSAPDVYGLTQAITESHDLANRITKRVEDLRGHIGRL